MNRNSKKPTSKSNSEKIVIDEEKNWVFDSEESLFEHFRPSIDHLEKEYKSLRKKSDFSDSDSALMRDLLELTLEEPDQIWLDNSVSKQYPIYHFHRMFEAEDHTVYYIASTYLQDEDPTFIFLHFPTRSMELSDHFRRGQIVFDRSMTEFEPALIEGDGLTEGDGLSLGLFSAMLKVRSEKDIPLEKFRDFAELREETIESPDEIWRSSDFQGNRLVTFIKEFNDFQGYPDVHYVVVTQEDGQVATVHSLLFSFPTTDESLLERYRNGENLQAEEVVQESSH
ncbi:MAG: hypothetical protein RJB66_920 [Pseudomonadota bacterium]